MKIELAPDGTVRIGGFNAIQAYRIARKMENDGIAFYENVRGTTRDERIKTAVTVLIDSEKKHRSFFEDALEKSNARSDNGFEEDDIVDYVSSNVFENADKKEARTVLDDARSVVALGAEFEKKAIAFYSALLQHTDDAESQKALRVIINEERQHLETFNRLL